MHIANLICMVGFALEISARQCGFPDEPYSSKVSPKKDVYFENEQVTYKCNNGCYALKGDKLLKEVTRTCQCSGVWSGIAPGCDYFDYIDTKKMRDTYSSALDDDEETYETLSLNSRKYDSDVTVDLLPNPPSTLLVSILYEATASQFWVRIVFWEPHGYSGNRTECYSSSDPTPPGTKRYRLISCNRGLLRISPDKLKIEFLRTEASQPASVQVYTLRVLGRITMECGSPTKLLNGNVTLNGDYADYSCNHGYTLIGSKRSTCLVTGNNMYWFTERPPICVSVNEAGCRQLPKVEYGLLMLTNPTCPTDYNIRDHSDVAVLHCEHGFRRKIKNPFAYCNESTAWTWQIDGQPLPFNGRTCLPTGELDTDKSTVTWKFAFIGLATAACVLIGVYILVRFKFFRNDNRNETYFISRVNYAANQGQRETNPRNNLVSITADDPVYEEIIYQENRPKQSQSGCQVDEFGYEVPRELTK